MRLLSYNILRGGYGRESLIAQVIAGAAPEIVLLQEAYVPQQVAKIAALAGYPVQHVRPGRSVACLSRVPLAQVAFRRNPWGRSPFLDVRPAGVSLRVIALHLVPHLVHPLERLRAREIGHLLRLLAADPTPAAIMGDFNAIAPGDAPDLARFPRVLQRLIGLYGDPRRDALANLIGAGFIDSFRRLHPADPGFSIPAHDPNSRLDYAFIARALLPHLTESQVLRPDVHGPATLARASDHLPVLLDLAL